MRSAGLLLGILALSWVFTGCRPPGRGPVYLGRGATFALRSPASGPSLFANQQVVFRLPDGSEETLLTTVENGPTRLSVVASTPFGQTVFTVQVTDTGTITDARVPLPDWFDVRLLPALIQLANWPLREVRAGLGQGLELQEQGPDRILFQEGRVLLNLHREGVAPPFRSLDLEIPSRHIRAHILTLDAP